MSQSETVSEFKVVNPATNETEREFATATDAEVEQVLERSARAYQSWRTTAKDERAKVLLRVAELYTERIDELAALITREMGKPTREAKGEIMLVVSIYRYYADQGPALLADTPLSPRAGGTALIRKEPVGPLLGIMPWNFPYYQVARFAAPNLMAGNTIILKHAPQDPESALAIEQIFRDAGLAEDAYINIFASNSQIADMIADPRVAGVSVTGSERAWRRRRRGGRPQPEEGRPGARRLGSLHRAGQRQPRRNRESGRRRRMGNAGQACTAAKRFIVVGDLYDQFVGQFTAAMAALRPGDPTDPASDLGPLSSEAAAERLMEQISDAVDKGATLHTGGQRVNRPGAFVEPTVLTDVTPQMRAYHEELFGPAAVIYRVADASEAVELANSSSFGLGGAVYSADPGRAAEVAGLLDTGMVWINSPTGSMADLPFGGTKRSGVGRELGSSGIEEFVNKKLIYTPAPR